MAAGTGDQTGALVADVGLVQAGVGDRLLHGHVGVGRRVAHEAPGLAVDMLFQVDIRRPCDLAAHAHFLIGFLEADAREAVPQRLGNLVRLVAEAGHDSQAGNHDATHI